SEDLTSSAFVSGAQSSMRVRRATSRRAPCGPGRGPPPQVVAERPLDGREADLSPGNGVAAEPAHLGHIAPGGRGAGETHNVDDGDGGRRRVVIECPAAPRAAPAPAALLAHGREPGAAGQAVAGPRGHRGLPGRLREIAIASNPSRTGWDATPPAMVAAAGRLT